MAMLESRQMAILWQVFEVETDTIFVANLVASVSIFISALLSSWANYGNVESIALMSSFKS